MKKLFSLKLYVLLFLHLFAGLLAAEDTNITSFAYWFFNFSYFVLFMVATKSKQLKTITFFGLMIWTGFYLKYIAHSIVRYSYIEPIGQFDFTYESWVSVFWVSTIGCIGFLVPSLMVKKIKRKSKAKEILKINSKKLFAYMGLPLVVIATMFITLNLKYGIILSGLHSETILPFKLNAIIGWMLYLGLIILATTYIKIEIDNGMSPTRGYLVASYLAFCSSVALLSRGIYLFHMLPIIYVLCFSSVCLTKTKKNIFVVSFFIFMIFTSVLSNSVRNMYYEGILSSDLSKQSENKQVVNQFYSSEKILKSLKQVSGLVVDRWIGIEGVMAVVAYDKRSIELLYSSLVKKLKPGELDKYSEISNSYKNPSKKYFFTSIPGIVAFLYYSNSTLVVFVGMMFVGFFLVFVESLISYYFSNEFLNAVLAFYFSLAFAQFGIAPRPIFISFFMTGSFLILLYWTQNIFLSLKCVERFENCRKI